MQVHTTAIENGVFHDRFGKRGSDFSPNGMPSRSIPFSISDAPAGTQSYAVVLDDKDAVTAVRLCVDTLAHRRFNRHQRA